MKAQGYYWHLSCIYGVPGGIRSDDGDEPERGDFVDRAITTGHARRLDNTDMPEPFCHSCLKDKDRSSASEGKTQEYFVVLDYELTAAMCNCGAMHRGHHHNNNRVLTDEVWQDAPAMEGAKVPDKVVCGDCWYRDNNLPPDERKTLETAARCSDCGDPVNEVIVIKRAPTKDQVVDVDEIDEDSSPEDYKVSLTWTRQEVVTVYYEYTLDRLDSDDLDMLANGDFNDAAWDVASDESTDDNETKREFYDWVNGVDDVEWEVLAK